MNASGLADDLIVATHSEFGRTVRDNGVGTDHGWANAGFVMSGATGAVNNQIIGSNLNLSYLTSNNYFQPTIDIRDYLTEILHWAGFINKGNVSEVQTLFPRLNHSGLGIFS
jgi:uncharacterized protein (DUF1501 family)